MIALPALDTAETAVEAGRYLSTCEAAVLGLPATSVVMPASTETLHHDVYKLCRCIAADSEGGGEGPWGHGGVDAWPLEGSRRFVMRKIGAWTCR